MNLKQHNTFAVCNGADVRFYDNGFVGAIEAKITRDFAFYRCFLSFPQGFRPSAEWMTRNENALWMGNVLTWDVTYTESLKSAWDEVNKVISSHTV